ncbi:transposase [Streptomyces aureoversilis]|uniref:Mutator family transposase n=1 Tax=Streptomyces aureoversilis TaxID=67277 RepID=A0ABW0A814_9ACTN
MIRASLRFASKQHHARLVTELKVIYMAPTEQALTEFAVGELGEKYPAIVRTWQAAWREFTPYLAFSPEIRKVVYSTNLIESINARLRKATRNCGNFPSEHAALKVFYLAVRKLITPKVRDINHVAPH